MRNCLQKPPSQNLSVIILLSLGCLSSLGLMLGWDKTSHIGGQVHSTGLFVAVFFLALVDCTSSVLFLPYMAIFKQIYLNSYLIGEGMSGFVPSIVALAQGVSGNPECVNGTFIPVTDAARFSTSTFFMFLMIMMVLSLVSFLLLHYLPTTRSERVSTTPSSSTNFSDVLDKANQSDGSIVGDCMEDVTLLDMLPLLVIQCLVCCLSNGALPSIQTYSCLPYGNMVYHFAVTLNAMANPLMAFIAFFFPCNKQSMIYILTGVGCILSGYIIATALESPEMIGGQRFGGLLVVLTWVLNGAVFSFVKVSVAGMCRTSGNLFSCGVVTQVGSAVGALVMFLLVNEVTTSYA